MRIGRERESRMRDFAHVIAYFSLGALIGWAISLHISDIKALQEQARPLEVKYLTGEKLTKEEAERLVRIHEEIGRIRGR
jgi:hypothetical protein